MDLKDILRTKDDKNDDCIAAKLDSFAYVGRNKDKWFILQEERNIVMMKLLKHCTPRCFGHFESTVITDEESECFTNCMGKAISIGNLFNKNYAPKEVERYSGNG
jgi:hypothetical protein